MKKLLSALLTAILTFSILSSFIIVSAETLTDILGDWELTHNETWDDIDSDNWKFGSNQFDITSPTSYPQYSTTPVAIPPANGQIYRTAGSSQWLNLRTSEGADLKYSDFKFYFEINPKTTAREFTLSFAIENDQNKYDLYISEGGDAQLNLVSNNVTTSNLPVLPANKYSKAVSDNAAGSEWANASKLLFVKDGEFMTLYKFDGSGNATVCREWQNNARMDPGKMYIKVSRDTMLLDNFRIYLPKAGEPEEPELVDPILPKPVPSSLLTGWTANISETWDNYPSSYWMSANPADFALTTAPPQGSGLVYRAASGQSWLNLRTTPDSWRHYNDFQFHIDLVPQVNQREFSLMFAIQSDSDEKDKYEWYIGDNGESELAVFNNGTRTVIPAESVYTKTIPNNDSGVDWHIHNRLVFIKSGTKMELYRIDNSSGNALKCREWNVETAFGTGRMYIRSTRPNLLMDNIEIYIPAVENITVKPIDVALTKGVESAPVLVRVDYLGGNGIPKPACVMVALFNQTGDKLLDIKTLPQTYLQAGATLTDNTIKFTPTEDNAQIRLFLWDGEDSMMPIPYN